MKEHFLIAYDIADPKRLRRIHKLVRGYGEAIQYSVFLGQLSAKDEVVLREKIRDIIHHKQDQVIMIRLGVVDGKSKTAPENWTVLGRKQVIRDFSLMIY